jgi:hypothetical protein
MYGELEEIIFILGTFILGDVTFALQGERHHGSSKRRQLARCTPPVKHWAMGTT